MIIGSTIKQGGDKPSGRYYKDKYREDLYYLLELNARTYTLGWEE